MPVWMSGAFLDGWDSSLASEQGVWGVGWIVTTHTDTCRELTAVESL